MSPPVTTLSPVALQRLLRGPKVNIYHKADDESERLLFRETYPRNVLVRFCGTYEKQFARSNTARLSNPVPSDVTIAGRDPQIYHEIFNWMRSCCLGAGLKKFPRENRLIFSHYARVLVAAQDMELNPLVEDMKTRLRGIANNQVFSDDIVEVFKIFPPGHYVRCLAIQSLGTAILERRVRGYRFYRDVQKKVHAFKRGVDHFLVATASPLTAPPNPLELENWEKPMSQAQELDIERRAAEIRRAWNPFYKPRPHRPLSSATESGNTFSHMQMPVTQLPLQHTTITTLVVRNGRNGRGRYVKPALKDLGITAQSFYGGY